LLYIVRVLYILLLFICCMHLLQLKVLLYFTPRALSSKRSERWVYEISVRNMNYGGLVGSGSVGRNGPP